MSNDKEIKLVFAPGCFDNFEGTQEELNELIEQIKAAFDSGELLEAAEQVDMIELSEEDPEMFSIIASAMAEDPPARKLH